MRFRFALLILLLPGFSCSSEPRTNSSNAPTTQPAQTSVARSPQGAETSREQVSFGRNLKISPRSVKLESEEWRYKINVEYPQIEGNDSTIRYFNQKVTQLVKQKYSWALKRPTANDRRRYLKWPSVYNSVDMDYDVTLATDELLSIYLIAYHYGIGAAHSVHESFSINYDLKRRRFFALPEVFRPGSQYLQFISRRCLEELSNSNPIVNSDPFSERLGPRSNNFESWNITTRGLRMNFDACRIASCAEGDLGVEIPFDEIRSMLNNDGPLKSLI